MKLLGFNNVLCLGVNYGDVEYYILGTVIRHHSTNFFVKNENKMSEVGQKESNYLWSAIKNIDEFKDNPMYQYDLILSPPKNDFEKSNRDLYYKACELSFINKCTLVTYKTISTTNSWVSNIEINIDEYYNKKVISLENYESLKNNIKYIDNNLKQFNFNGGNHIESFLIEQVKY
tara:strand:+ start:104 stop:628 length:525 start_codon:yes stop_codon:yes gene_type:complete